MAHHLILINNHALLVPDEIPLSIHIHSSMLVAHSGEMSDKFFVRHKIYSNFT